MGNEKGGHFWEGDRAAEERGDGCYRRMEAAWDNSAEIR